MSTVTHINPETLHRGVAFTQVVRVPAGFDTIYVGGQNGVGPDGKVVGPDVASQVGQALMNLRACLEAAGGSVRHVVKWSFLLVDGVSPGEGLTAFGEFWPRDAPPPALTVAMVSGLAVPGALCEVEAVAVVPSS